MAVEASSDQVYSLVAAALDAGFYRAIYDDVAETGVDPVRHYMEAGWREDRDPAPWFSTRAYRDDNPDLGPANPFHHYLTRGWREGRETRASQFAAPYLWRAADAGRSAAWTASSDFASGPATPATGRLARSKPQSPAEARAQIADHFDAEFYLSANPDIVEADCDPLDHFVTTGWREGRDPARGFSVADYLELNPDVAAAGLNPFAHYVTAGRAEGRPVRHGLGFRHQVIARLTSLEARRKGAAEAVRRVAVREAADLKAAMLDRRSEEGGLHITLSHDNFLANVGGVQLCLQREAAAIAARGVDHLHLYPAAPWPTLRGVGQPSPTGVLWNGHDLGAFPAAAIAEAVATLPRPRSKSLRSFALHNLLGHCVDEVLALLEAARMTRGFLWLHDFTSLCAGVHLMRDDVADCGAPPVGSAACGICVYGKDRAFHVAEHQRLFQALDLTVAAPSRSTYETWRGATAAPADQRHVIHPHATLKPTGRAIAASKGPLTVAYLGMAAAHKGWPAFADLATRFADDPRYRFLHLASTPVPGSPAAFHQVSVTAEAPAAMRDALERNGVDVAVLWSLCRETFSFTAHEAAAAGVAVLTSPDSGNIAAFVAETGQGRVLEDEAALTALFEGPDALSLSRAVRKPAAQDLILGALTVDLLGAR